MKKIPSSKSQGNPKHQIPKRNDESPTNDARAFGSWSFFGAWGLGFGAFGGDPLIL
jgi:hypothetical protein